MDELLSKVDLSEILSKDGLFNKLEKQLIERVLQSELEHELGYDKHSKKGKKSLISADSLQTLDFWQKPQENVV